MADLVPTARIAIPLGAPQRHAVVASPGSLERHGRPRVPSDLLRHSCVRVRLPSGSLFRWELRKRGQPALFDVAGRITLDEASLARIAVLDGIGLGFFMEPDVRGDIVAGRLVRVLEDWTPELARLCLYHPSRRNASAAHQAFVALAREVARAEVNRRSDDVSIHRRGRVRRACAA